MKFLETTFYIPILSYNLHMPHILYSNSRGPAGIRHKMQSISVVFSTLHCEGYIADLRYRWLITSVSARWLFEILSAILKSTRHGGQSTERL